MENQPTQGFKIKPARIEDVAYVANNLLQEGIQDFLRAGINPVLQMSLDVTVDKSYVVLSPDNVPAALLGISRDGCMWMNMTHEIRKHPKAFIKAAKKWINELDHPILWNQVDIQNTQLLKFIKLLGFKFLRILPFGTNNIYYVEFVKLCQ